LLDPKALRAQSTMPSYPFLSKTVFEKDSIIKYIGKMSIKELEKLITFDLDSYNIEVKLNAEIVALIQYLNNIPEGDVLKNIRLNGIELMEIEKKKEDSFWKNSEQLIKNILNDKTGAISGKAICMLKCSICHGEHGEGKNGPNLTDNYWLNGSDDSSIVNTIVNGVPDKGMIS